MTCRIATFFVSLGFLVAVLSGCGPEKQVPEAPDTSTAQASTAAQASERNSNEEGGTTGKGEYAGWGAHAGTTDILARLAKCNQAGNFFNRAGENGKGICDTKTKVLGNCNSFDSVKEITKMGEDQITEVQGLLAEGKELFGFLFDQCVDGGKDTDGSMIYLIWLVSQSADGSIALKKLTIH